MATTHHVFGPAVILTGTGSGSSLETLGYTVDGVEIQFEYFTEPIYNDVYGPKMPHEMQHMLMDVKVVCDLIYYDRAVLDKIITGVPGAGITTGLLHKAGDLVIANSLYCRLLIRSTPQGTGLSGAETCYNFPIAFPIETDDYKAGVVRSTHKLKWQVMAAQGASASVNQLLFNTTCT